MVTVIREVRVPGKADLLDLAIEDERIVACRRRFPKRGSVEFRAHGRLALPGFVNSHVHLDKALVGRGSGQQEARTRSEALEFGREAKRRFSTEDITSRATGVIEDAIVEGTCAIRGFADVDPIIGLTAVRALIALQRTYASELVLQVAAHPQEAIFASPGTATLMEQAMEAGTDVVGGVPAREPSEALGRQHIDYCLDLAKRFGKDVHMMIDDTDSGTSRTLEYLALRTVEEGYQGRVVASHCGALSSYEDQYAERVIELVRKAQITVCCNPHIGLVLGGREDRGRVGRGITRVHELLEAGVEVITAQDDVDDPFYPFGRMDQLEIAHYMSHVAHLTSLRERWICIDMVTTTPAKAIGLQNYGLEEGCWADLVVLDASSISDAFRYISPRRWVFFRGRVVSETSVERKRSKPGGPA